MTCSEWSKRLAPGTLLYNENNPGWGFFLVYHTEVTLFPGPWLKLTVWLVDPRCKLSKLEIESDVFSEHWNIVDVER
jgi:hypothetical protein